VLAREWHAGCSKHVCHPLAGDDEQRGAELTAEGGGQGLRLLAVVAVALQQHARAVLLNFFRVNFLQILVR
jgi:hypothetical protein